MYNARPSDVKSQNELIGETLYGVAFIFSDLTRKKYFKIFYEYLSIFKKCIIFGFALGKYYITKLLGVDVSHGDSFEKLTLFFL